MIHGLVQGVGFRPFVCRMAEKHALSGEVENRTDGVTVRVSGEYKKIGLFSDDLIRFAPPASRIKSIEINPSETGPFESFTIVESKHNNNLITEISPDIAVCSECLNDLSSDSGRVDYPFINCTNCGPRFTIIESLPYDRPLTAMKNFDMCVRCEKEYNDILNRRFHAQPIGCNSCGPVYLYKDWEKNLSDIEQILEKISVRISGGKIIAVKGLGGYFLMCDALNNEAVMDLRHRKQRDSKPFAVMFRDIMTVRDYCHITESEENEIMSWQRPVVILRQKKVLAESVSNGLKTTGAMLPYMPLHYMLFRAMKCSSVVFTSGNFSDEPIITDDIAAEEKLQNIADSFLTCNRPIINRADDSVIRIINNRKSFIRRSRGYVPRPVDLKFDVNGILALGAEQKNSFCIGKGNQAIMSQYIGDLKNDAAYNFFTETISRFSDLFRFRPSLLGCDLHPDYLSTRYAQILEQELNIPLVRIQHHHAHIASCMAEHDLDEEVIGVSLDGTGYGTDGNIWGGEFLIADLKSFRRYSHFDYIPLPGGEKAIDEPWRMAFSYLYRYLGDDFDFDSLPLFRSVGMRKVAAIKDMIDKKINTPLSSGAGRLFDAVAALSGLCGVAEFESEAPMRLESAIEDTTDEFYPFTSGETIGFSDTLKGLLIDLKSETSSVISSKFHNTIARIISDVAQKIRNETALNKVVLSGGVFQNRYLTEKSISLLHQNGFNVSVNNIVPPNDGGISLGQMLIASKLNNYVS